MSGTPLRDFLAAYPPGVRSLVLLAREEILKIHPGAVEKVWPGWKVVGYGVGPAMADVVVGVAPTKSRIGLHFSRGTELSDPGKLLEGVGKRHRHLKIEEVATLRSRPVRAMLREAFRLAREDGAGKERAAKQGAARRGAAGEGTARKGATASATAPTTDEQVRATSHLYQVGGSRTVAVPVETLWDAWTDEATRARWMPRATFTVRKATPAKSLRITWGDGSNLQVLFYPKGEAKSIVTVDHRGLRDAAAIERMREFWRERLARLKTVVEG